MRSHTCNKGDVLDSFTLHFFFFSFSFFVFFSFLLVPLISSASHFISFSFLLLLIASSSPSHSSSSVLFFCFSFSFLCLLLLGGLIHWYPIISACLQTNVVLMVNAENGEISRLLSRGLPETLPEKRRFTTVLPQVKVSRCRSVPDVG